MHCGYPFSPPVFPQQPLPTETFQTSAILRLRLPTGSVSVCFPFASFGLSSSSSSFLSLLCVFVCSFACLLGSSSACLLFFVCLIVWGGPSHSRRGAARLRLTYRSVAAFGCGPSTGPSRRSAAAHLPVHRGVWLRPILNSIAVSGSGPSTRARRRLPDFITIVLPRQ